jgi:HK97 family phage portal protein
MSVSPEDAEVLASRRFTVEELCRLFQVPPPIVQSYEFNTFTNSAQADLWFARHSLQPWARKIEAEFARTVFGDATGTFHLEFDFSAMTRGDYETRWKANIGAVGAGILTKDEVREAEGYPPLAGAPDAAAGV